MVDTLKSDLYNAMQEEFARSIGATSRATVKLRVLFKVAKILKIPRDHIYETKDLLHIEPSVSASIEKLWLGFSLLKENENDSLSNSSLFHENASYWRKEEDVSRDDRMIFETFQSKDFAKPTDISKAVSVLRKKMTLLHKNEEFNASKRNIQRNLWLIFAVDGLSGSENEDDLTAYYGNLCYAMQFGERNFFPDEQQQSLSIDEETPESPSETHVRAIRTLFREHAYITPGRIKAVLKTWLVQGDKEINATTSTAGSNFLEEGEQEYHENFNDDSTMDDFLLSQYKRCISIRLDNVVKWLRRRLYIEELQRITKKNPPKTKRSAEKAKNPMKVKRTLKVRLPTKKKQTTAPSASTTVNTVTTSVPSSSLDSQTEINIHLQNTIEKVATVVNMEDVSEEDSLPKMKSINRKRTLSTSSDSSICSIMDENIPNQGLFECPVVNVAVHEKAMESSPVTHVSHVDKLSRKANEKCKKKKKEKDVNNHRIKKSVENQKQET